MSFSFKLRSSRSSAPVQSPATQRNSSTACAAHTGVESCRAAASAKPSAAAWSWRPGAPTERAGRAELAGAVARCKLLEGRDGRVAIAGKLRALRGEEKRERLARGDAQRLGGEFLRPARVAGADRDQPARDRAIAALAAALAPV